MTHDWNVIDNPHRIDTMRGIVVNAAHGDQRDESRGRGVIGNVVALTGHRYFFEEGIVTSCRPHPAVNASGRAGNDRVED